MITQIGTGLVPFCGVKRSVAPNRSMATVVSPRDWVPPLGVVIAFMLMSSVERVKNGNEIINVKSAWICRPVSNSTSQPTPISGAIANRIRLICGDSDSPILSLRLGILRMITAPMPRMRITGNICVKKFLLVEFKNAFDGFII